MLYRTQDLKQTDIVKKQIQYLNFTVIYGMEILNYTIKKIGHSLVKHTENYTKKP